MDRKPSHSSAVNCALPPVDDPDVEVTAQLSELAETYEVKVGEGWANTGRRIRRAPTMAETEAGLTDGEEP